MNVHNPNLLCIFIVFLTNNSFSVTCFYLNNSFYDTLIMLQRGRRQAKDDLENANGWGYEGYGTKARNGNGPREVEVWHHGENA